MLIAPKKWKYRKQFKHQTLKGNGGVTEHVSHQPSGLQYGTVGVKAVEVGRRTARQLEAGRRVRRKHLNRQGKVWIIVFTDVPVTKKPTEVRMGKGSGSVAYWACIVRPGTMRFEVSDVDRTTAEAALRKVTKKMPIRCRVVIRPNIQIR